MDGPSAAAVRSPTRSGATGAVAVGDTAATAAESWLEVRLFGGVDLRWRGAPLPGLRSSRRTRSLLQHLILARGESVARDELAFELWPDVPDAQARVSLRQALLRAARVLPNGDQFVLRTPTGAAWNTAAPASVDVLRFDALLQQATAARVAGDAVRLVEALQAAVALYRGDIDVDVSGGRLERARAALQRDVQEALRELVPLHLDAGRTGDAVASCERLLELDPLDEPSYATLMRLYEASGAPRKGLRVFERLTTVLRDEVSDTPGEVTAALAVRLGHRLVRDEGVPAGLDPRLQRLLGDGVERSRHAGPQLLLVRAPPGHPLVALVAPHLRDAGAAALVGRAASGESALPYAAASRLLGPARLAAAAERIDAPWSTELRRLVGATATTASPAATVAAAAHVDALHEALTATLQADGGPIAIVLQDAQHLDAASAGWLWWLLDRAEAGPLIVLVTSATAGSVRTPLDDTLELARRAARLTTFEAGPPALSDGRLLDARLRALSGIATRVLEGLAVLGLDAEPETLRRMVALQRPEVAVALDELTRSGFTEAHDDGRTVTFRSAVERDAVLARMAPPTRTLLHAQAADALRSASRGLARHDAIVAEHLERAGRTAEAVAAWAEAARRAASVAVLDAAIASYERAIALAADAANGAHDPAAEPLWRELGEVHARRLDGARARRAFDVAAQHADGDVVALALLSLRRAESHVAQRAYEAAYRELDLAETALRAQARRSRRWWRTAIDVAAVRARTLYFAPAAAADDAETRRALLANLEHAVQRHGTLAQRFEVEHAALRFRSRDARYRLSEADRVRAEDAERTAIATGDPLAIADARFGLAFTTLFAGDPEGAIVLLSDARRLAERYGVRLLLVQSLAYLGVACRLTRRVGPLREAQRELAAVVDGATPLYEGLAHAQRAYLAFLDTDHDAALDGVARALAVWGERWYPFRWTANAVAVALEDAPGTVREAARAMLAPDQHRPHPPLERALERLVKARNATATTRLHAALSELRHSGWL